MMCILVKKIIPETIQKFMLEWLKQECKDFKLVFVDKDLDAGQKQALQYAKKFAQLIGLGEVVQIVKNMAEIQEAYITKVLESTKCLPTDKLETMRLGANAQKPLHSIQALGRSSDALVESASCQKLASQNGEKKDGVFFKIVIPNYNNIAYVKKCLDSILEQTFQDFFIVFVDDQSTDLSYEFAKSYEKKFPSQLAVLRAEAKSQAGGCRNIGIDYPMKCEYVWFIDSDDWIYDKYTLNQIYNIANCNKYDVIRCALVNKYNDNYSTPDKRINSINEILYAGCGPSRNIVSSKIKCRFVENRSKWNDVVWLASVIDQVDDDRILISSINILNYNRFNPMSSTNNTNSQKNIISKIRLYSDLAEKHYRKPYVKEYKAYMQQKSLDIANTKNMPIVECTGRKKIVAMASFPARKEGMLNVIEQLHSQCDKIYIWLNDYDSIPKELHRYENVEAKLAGEYSFLKENGRLFWIKRHKNDYYLTVDDDINYPPNYVQTIVNEIEYYGQNAIVSFHGTIFTKRNTEKYFPFSERVEENIQVHRIGGGVAGFIPSKIYLDYSSMNDFKTWDGDATLSVLATKHGIKKYVIAHQKGYLTSYIGSDGKLMAFKNALCLNKETKKRRAIWYDSVEWEKL